MQMPMQMRLDGKAGLAQLGGNRVKNGSRMTRFYKTTGNSTG